MLGHHMYDRRFVGGPMLARPWWYLDLYLHYTYIYTLYLLGGGGEGERDDRTCELCFLNKLDDEFHYLFECSYFEDQKECTFPEGSGYRYGPVSLDYDSRGTVPYLKQTCLLQLFFCVFSTLFSFKIRSTDHYCKTTHRGKSPIFY